MHSFFIEDLEKAKKLSTENLNKYLFGFAGNKINLDSQNESDSFNTEALEKILMPKNYPLGRFPSYTKYALSFMQQIAVNLSVGLDSSKIRSVNGPPGTGKTTLLKDVFAELVVKQAYYICHLSKKEIRSSGGTNDKDSIGLIPENIAENSIVVASSNNGAVQNIVNELPLLDGIEEELVDELKKVDYFQDIANSATVEEDNQPVSNKPLHWGLFSLEGGKNDNMKKVLLRMKKVVEYFSSGQYEENPGIYEEFIKQYCRVKNYRDKINQLIKDKNKRTSLIKDFRKLQ